MTDHTTNHLLTDLVYGEVPAKVGRSTHAEGDADVPRVDKTLVLIPRDKALELAGTWHALATSSTWGEFRSLVSAKRYEEVVNLCRNPPQCDEDPFPGCDIPTVEHDGYPENASQEMLKWVPKEIIDAPYSETRESSYYGDFLVLDPRHKEQILAVFRSAGFDCTEDQDLVLRATGNAVPTRQEGSIPYLIKAVTSKGTYGPENAVADLQELGEKAIRALHEALKDKKDAVRKGVAWALGEIRPATEATVMALGEALKDECEDVAAMASNALGSIGAAARDAVPALTEALKDKRDKVREQACCALGNIGQESDSVVPVLIEALKDHSSWVRASATRALGQLGQRAAAPIPALVDQLKHSSGNIDDLAEALGRIGDVGVIGLTRALTDESEVVRQRAVHALGQLGPKAKNAVPSLIQALSDKNEEVRKSAVNALRRIGLESKLVVEPLVQVLKDKHWQVRLEALEALVEIPAGNQVARRFLIEALKDSEFQVSRFAALNLAEIAPEAHEAIPALIELMKEDLRAAVSALWKIGPKGRAAAPAITEFQSRLEAVFVDKPGPAPKSGRVLVPSEEVSVTSLFDDSELKDGDDDASENGAENWGEIMMELLSGDETWLVYCGNPDSMASGMWGLKQFELGGRGYIYHQPDPDAWSDMGFLILSAWEPFEDKEVFSACFVDTYTEVWEAFGLPPYFAGEAWGSPYMAKAIFLILHSKPDMWSKVIEVLRKRWSKDFTSQDEIATFARAARSTVDHILGLLQDDPDDLEHRARQRDLSQEEQRVVVGIYYYILDSARPRPDLSPE